ncbi:hypothetical protein [Streptomyces sp. KS 21]|uniref:hypothetical protein n=1 Tax=Streptomyces sp. KS 21 TaxID=2485150 RepID=UPI0010639865|nr:hypothetical protein [Streptomyces sp. KS 21]TDU77813.1 hypothetical protein EDD91_4575 [Streptomyces sp. KS 21]
MRSRTIGLSVLATSALFGLTTACLPGGGGKAADVGRAARAAEQASAGATPPPTAKGKDKDKGTGVLADLSGAEILNQSYEAMRKVESAHVVAKMREEGKQVEFDLSLDKKGGCNGAIRYEAMGKVDLVKSSDLMHFKGDADYWRAVAAKKHTPKKQTDAMVTMLADRWLKMPLSDPEAASFAHVCDLGKLTGGTSKPSPLARKGETVAIDGKQALAITSAAKEGTEVDYIATQGTPYLLKSTISGDESGEILFSAFGTPVDTALPEGADVLDLSKLGGGAPGESV